MDTHCCDLIFDFNIFLFMDILFFAISSEIFIDVIEPNNFPLFSFAYIFMLISSSFFDMDFA